MACGAGTVLKGSECVAAPAPAPDAAGPVIAEFGATALYGEAPFTTTLNWALNSPAGQKLTCTVDTNGDGKVDSTISDCSSASTAPASFSAAGKYDAVLVVSDEKGRTATATTRLYANHVDFVPNLKDVRNMAGLADVTVADASVTLTFTNAASVPALAAGDVLWDRGPRGFVRKVVSAQTSGASVAVTTSSGTLADVATGGFYGVRDVVALPTGDQPVPLSGGKDGWSGISAGLPDFDTSLDLGGKDKAHITIERGSVFVGAKVAKAEFDWTALSIALDVRARAQLAGKLGAQFPIAWEPDPWPIPIPSLNAVIDLKLLQARVGFVPKVGFSAKMQVAFGADAILTGDVVFTANASMLAGTADTTFAIVPDPSVTNLTLSAEGEAKIFMRPELEISWGETPQVCKPGAGFKLSAGVETGVKLTGSASGSKVCGAVSFYGEARGEFQPPLALTACTELTAPLYDYPLIAQQCFDSASGPGDAGPGDSGPGDSGPGDSGPGDSGSDGGGCSPAVTQVSPTTATLGQAQTFFVAGTCLPASLDFTVANCGAKQTLSLGASLAAFRCTPSQAGSQAGTVRAALAGATLATFSVAVADNGAVTCDAPYVACNGSCVDTATNPDHCGGCNQPCGANAYCAFGACAQTGVKGPSCNGLGNICGPAGTMSCCESTVIPGGAFPMGRSAAGTDAYASGGSDEQPEHTATLNGYRLDLFEVTVGRFRRYVSAFPGNKPAVLAGAHPLIPGSGWQTAWNANLQADQATLLTNLKCNATYQTWTDNPAANEAMAINCVSWFDAFAFCAWDGGFLPTEAEWEFAAAGGNQNLLYPWGATAPSTQYANYSASAYTPYLPVGSYPLGVGRWGQYDLAGGMWEWALDWYDSAYYANAGNVCNNCSSISNGAYRVVRGGSWNTTASYLRAAQRNGDTPSYRGYNHGFRCARTP